MLEAVRLDKWLYVARVFKTRSLAKRACDLGRVRVEGAVAKPHRSLHVGERVEAEIGDWTRILIVKELRDKPIRKADVPGLFDDLSPPRPTLDAFERAMRASNVRREPGRGRPSKKERRVLDKLRGA